MAEAGHLDVDTYGSHRQKTVTQFITTRPIMDLCLTAKRRSGSRISKRWWEQDGVDEEGMQMAARGAKRT